MFKTERDAPFQLEVRENKDVNFSYLSSWTFWVLLTDPLKDPHPCD